MQCEMGLTLASIRVGRHVVSPHGDSSFPSGKRRSCTLHGAAKYQAVGGACLEQVISTSGMTGPSGKLGRVLSRGLSSVRGQRHRLCVSGFSPGFLLFPKVNNTWTRSSASLTSVFSSVKWEEPPILQAHLLRGKGSQGPVGVRTARAEQRPA